jgi:hypothetical protein
MLKAYITYTPSHKIFYDRFFLPTLPKDIELHEQFITEYVGGPITNAKTWVPTSLAKNQRILEVIRDNQGEIIISCDVDICWFTDCFTDIAHELIQDYDIVAQHELSGELCYGFQIIKCNAKSLELYSMLVERLQNELTVDTPYSDMYEQALLNICKMAQLANMGIIDDNIVWTTRNPYRVLFDPSNGLGDYIVPSNIAVYHANWIGTLEHKIKAMKLVQTAVRENLQ